MNTRFSQKTKTTLVASFILSSVLFNSGCSDSNSGNDFHQQIQQSSTYLKQKQFKATIISANKAILAAPDKIDGYLILAEAYSQLGSPIDAIEVLKTYQGQVNADYNFLLLESYIKAGKHLSANDLIEENIDSLSTNLGRLALNKGKLALLVQDWTAAASHFSAISEDKTLNVDSLIGLARVDALNNQIDIALNKLEQAAQLSPKNIESRILKSYLLINQGKLSLAEQELSNALTLLPASDIFTPERINILQALTETLTLQGRSAEAVIYSRILADEFPGAESINSQYSQAIKHFNNKEFEDAIVILEKITQSTPGHKKASTLLGVILYSQGNFKGANKYLTNMIDPETDSDQLTQLYAMTQLKLSQTSELVSLLENTIDSETNPEILQIYTLAAINQNELSKALSSINKLKLLEPNSPKLALIESVYYSSLAQPNQDKALEVLLTALEKHASDAQLQMAYLKKLVELKNYEAADKYTTTLLNTPNNTEATLTLIADYYIHRQELEPARVQLEKALTISPQYKPALYGLARINQNLKDWEAVKQQYKNILVIYPEDILAYQGIIISLVQQNKPVNQLREILPENANPAIADLVLASYQAQQNNLKEAQELLASAKSNLPNQFKQYLDSLKLELNFRRSSSALTYGDFEVARTNALEAIKEAPRDPKLLALLTTIEIRSGQLSEADKILSQIKDIVPNDPIINIFGAEIAIAKNDPKKAIELLNHEWMRGNSDRVAQKLFSVLNTYDKGNANDFLTSWQKKNPQSLMALLNKAISEQTNGNKYEAISMYETLLKSVPNDPTSLNNLAWLYYETKNIKALELAKKAVEIAPNNANVLDTYAWILYKSGFKEQAQTFIEQAYKLNPTDPSIKEHWQEISQ